jgi:integrase
MTKKRDNHEGNIEVRGDGVFRLRYRVDGVRYAKTFKGTTTKPVTMSDARKELRKLLNSGDDGTHVPPDRITVGQWIDQWIAAGAPGRKRKKVSERTLERYEELLRLHIKPALGNRPLQKLAATEIDKVYLDLETRVAPMTARHIHVVFNSCLSKSEQKGILTANPMRRAEKLPSPGESDHGLALDEIELAQLVDGFRGSSISAIVHLKAATGMRRGEVLALRWTDHDPVAKTIKIERALEQTKRHGVRVKAPKTERGKRTVSLDAGTNTMLVKERERHLQLMAGIPDSITVDLSLIKLPAHALMFPAAPERDEEFDFMKPRNPRNFSKEFARRVALMRDDAGKAAFPGFKLHHLRGTHATLLLDRGVPVHVVAERIGDDPAVLLKNYAKRKRKNTADTSVSAHIEALASGFSKS